MLISPAEPSSLKGPEIGIVSPLPEQMGADFLFLTNNNSWVGVQRKTVDDFVGSVHDGRLQKEVVQLGQNCTIGILLIEGRPSWTTDGQLMGWATMTRAGWRGLLMSIQAGGVIVSSSDGIEDTIRALVEIERWAGKDVHTSLVRRPGPVGQWGRPSSREWCLHVLQGFEGMGPGMAAAIYDHFGGLPLTWSVTEAELREVVGIGDKRARSLMRSLVVMNGDENGQQRT